MPLPPSKAIPFSVAPPGFSLAPSVTLVMKERTVNRLSDGLDELNRMADAVTPIIAYGFVWLAAVLRRIGEIGEIGESASY
jgi:hypothetical protein